MHDPETLLRWLLTATPRKTTEAPDDARGLYGLVDHLGQIRYIGSTSAPNETLRKRIHLRHRTGSESTSHYFSRMYNSGRMWRDRDDAATKSDGDIAKALRNEFVSDHCRAVWLPMPDSLNIAQLEMEVLAIAPPQATAWNRRGMDPYDEPVELVDATIKRLGLGAEQLAAIDRQRLRWLAASGSAMRTTAPASGPAGLPVLPSGPFRFVALDVETANNHRGSICQIGLAFVRPDNTIETWSTHIDPVTDDWSCTRIHGITARTVQGAPSFAEILPRLEAILQGLTVFQHSNFDSIAISAACRDAGLPTPDWHWQDSVRVARSAWPELKGNGGHGLASLKRHLNLCFDHHDAGEDARAAAEVVILAECRRPILSTQNQDQINSKPVITAAEDFDLFEPFDQVVEACTTQVDVKAEPEPVTLISARLLGTTEITQGNIDNGHIYLRPFFEKFPADAIGGSNKESAAQREVVVDWGGPVEVMTDLDGVKQFFRRRGWVKDFFRQNGIAAGDVVMVEETAPYHYRVSLPPDRQRLKREK